MIADARTNAPNPIHTDAAVARDSPFVDVIASFGHTVSLYTRFLGLWSDAALISPVPDTGFVASRCATMAWWPTRGFRRTVC